jgi:glycopeptide antibiotics resistance protein
VFGSIRLEGEWAFLPLLAIIPTIAWHGTRTAVGLPTILVRALVAFYVAAIVAAAFFPLPLPPYATDTGVFDYRGWPYPWFSPIPFETIRSSLGLGLEWPAARYLIGNVLAFAPLGILVSLVRAGSSLRRVLGVAAVASIGIELTQLAMSFLMGVPYRVADIDDVILNVIGAMLGWVVLRPFVRSRWAR